MHGLSFVVVPFYWSGKAVKHVPWAVYNISVRNLSWKSFSLDHIRRKWPLMISQIRYCICNSIWVFRQYVYERSAYSLVLLRQEREIFLLNGRRSFFLLYCWCDSFTGWSTLWGDANGLYIQIYLRKQYQRVVTEQNIRIVSLTNLLTWCKVPNMFPSLVILITSKTHGTDV